MMRAVLPLLGLLLCAAAASLARGAQPAPSPEPQDGSALFGAQCGGCHLENGFGTRILTRRMPAGEALLEQRENLDGGLVKVVVRRGIGSMPQIRRTELSDGDLERIARYLEDGA